MLAELISLFGILAFVLIIIHNVLYFYLEISNNHFKFISGDFFFDFFMYYKKAVKQNQLLIVQISDFTLKWGAIAFGICLILLIIKVL